MERDGHLLLPLHHISSISSIQEMCNLWVSLTLSSPTSYPSLCPISFLFDVFTFPVYSVSIHNRKGTYTYLIIWDNALAHQALCSAFYMHRLSAVCHQHSRCCRALPICIIIFPLFFFFFWNYFFPSIFSTFYLFLPVSSNKCIFGSMNQIFKGLLIWAGKFVMAYFIIRLFKWVL